VLLDTEGLGDVEKVFMAQQILLMLLSIAPRSN